MRAWPARARAEIAATRRAETEAAAEVLGLTTARILSIPDGELANTAVVREAVTRRIREVRAQTLLSVDLTSVFFENRYYNHSDHRTAGWITLDSAFPGSVNPHFFPEHLDEGLEVRDVHDVWLAWTNDPNHAEDVSDHFATKIYALACHASRPAEGIRFFEEFLQTDARQAGERAGVALAEEYRVLDLG